jgi:YD repeat-containing protein
MTDPDMGPWQYGYDALGNLTWQTDARGQSTCLYYDALNRLTGKSYRLGGNCPAALPVSPDVKYTYDLGTYGKGHRTGMTTINNGPSASWEYNSKGLLESETQSFSGGSYATSWTYNSAGLVETMVYPGGSHDEAGEAVHFSYNALMQLQTVTGDAAYVSNMDYDRAGRMTSRTLGNGITQLRTYHPWTTQGGRLKTITAGALQDLSYTYDPAGNILEIGNSAADEKQTFRYDSLDRLRCAGR